MKPKVPTLPYATVIYQLTMAQRRQIRRLQAEGMSPAEDRHEVMVLNRLSAMGITTAHGDHKNPIFSLAEAWQEVDVSQKLPKNIKLPSVKAPPKASAEAVQKLKREPVTVQPDPPKPKFSRPPAVYSNPQHEEIIDNILKTDFK